MPENATLDIGIKPKIDSKTLDEQVKILEKKFADVKVKGGMFERLKTGIQLGAKRGEAAGGGLLGQMSGAMSGIMSALGPIGIAILAISGIILSFKPLMNVIKMIGKLLMELLRPISDVIMILLMPILVMLRPIIKMIHMIMAPFRKAAMKMIGMGAKEMKEGDMGAAFTLFFSAFQTMFTGLNMVILSLISNVLKAVTTVIGSTIKIVSEPIWFLASLIAKLFGEDAIALVAAARTSFMSTIDDVVGFMNSQIDNVLGASIMARLALIDSVLTDIIGPSGDAIINLKDFGTLINKVFADSTVNFEALGVKLETLTTDADGLFGLMKNNIDILGTTWSTVFSQMKSDLQALAESIGAGKATERKKGLLEKMRDWIKAPFVAAGKLVETYKQYREVKGSTMGDFIMRPGQPPVKINPRDTIVGTKGGGGVGGGNTFNIVVNATVNNDMDLRRLASQLSENLNREMARKVSY